MSTKTIQPLGDRVIVKRLEPEEKTASGIIIPDSNKEKPAQGVVTAIGSKITDIIGVGQTVLFNKWNATEVKVEGEDLLVLREEDVLAVIKDTK